MDPIAALFANWLKMETPLLLSLATHEAEATVKGALLKLWTDHKAKIVHTVAVHDGITLDPAKSFTAKDGKIYTHPEAFARDVVFWLWHQLPIGGTGSDVVRDLQTPQILSELAPQLTQDLTPEAAFDKCVDWEASKLPF